MIDTVPILALDGSALTSECSPSLRPLIPETVYQAPLSPMVVPVLSAQRKQAQRSAAPRPSVSPLAAAEPKQGDGRLPTDDLETAHLAILDLRDVLKQRDGDILQKDAQIRDLKAKLLTLQPNSIRPITRADFDQIQVCSKF